MLVSNPRCEWRTSPLIDVAAPRLTWELSSPTRGDLQTAYQVQCGSAAGGSDLWDSGKVTSAAQFVAYAGATLTSRKHVYWRVRVWDANGMPSNWTAADFEVGLLNTSDWGAAVPIGYLTGASAAASNPSPHLRKTFTPTSGKTVARARLYATAIGLYRPSLNGQRVGNHELAPGWTDYGKRLHYQMHDVTALLGAGTNVLGMALGDGWACGNLNRGTASPAIGRQNWAAIPYGLCILYIDYTDGTTSTVVSDTTWKATTSANQSNDLYDGGATDGRQVSGFTSPAISDASWPSVSAITFPSAPLQAQTSPPIRRQEVLTPVAAPTSPSAGTYIFDMGKIHSGFPSLTVSGAAAGQLIILRYGERLNSDGTLFTANLRTAAETFAYTCRGLPEETFEPLHCQVGGRYIQITGYPGAPPTSAISSVRIATDMTATASFTSQSAPMNAVWAAVNHTLDANAMGTFSDCNQRDERLGWAFDALSSARALTYLRDALAYLQKYAIDFDDTQVNGQWGDVAPYVGTWHHGSSGWSHAGYVVPTTLWLASGDTSILSKHYAAMQAGLNAEPGANNWGDFLYLDVAVSASVMNYAWACRAAQLVQQVATALGDTTTANTAASKLASFTASFQALINSDGTISGGGQAAYVLALAFGLAGSLTSAVMGQLVSLLAANGIQCGLIGTVYLLDALTMGGRPDLAYQYATQVSGLGWAQNAVTQGLTTTPERWDFTTHVMSGSGDTDSGCHHVRGGCYAEWLMKRVAGIDYDPSAPGYRNVLLRPMLTAQLGWAEGVYQGPRGRISSRWSQTSKGFQWDFEVPANSTATITVPSNNTPKEAGSPVSYAPLSADPVTGYPRYAVGSGRFSIFA